MARADGRERVDITATQDFRRFGPYVLLRCSGAGGFGRIDLALKGRPDLAKICVVKRMLEGERGPEIEARFRREAQIALQLSHGAIAQTVGVEQIEGELCLLQEFVDGVNLRHLQNQCDPELVPVPVAIHIVCEVARALAYAHGFGIVHRDVAPENVMLGFDGQVKLIDFGIARGPDDATLTETGTVVGRETYTAPEVWAGGKADPRADVFSLGVVLWQLATGRGFQEVQNEKRKEIPDPCGVNEGLPRELGDVILRALATDPDARFQSARQFLESLGPLQLPGFVAEPALAAFLARHFNVEREKRILADDVAAAKRLLGAPIGMAPPRRALRGVAGVMTGVVLAVLVVAIVARTMRRSDGRLGAVPTGSASKSGVVLEELPLVAPAPAAISPPGQVHLETDEDAKTALSRRSGLPRLPLSPRAEGPKPIRKAATTNSDATGLELLKQARERWDTDDVDGALSLAKRAAERGGGSDAHVLIGTVLLKKEHPRDAEREFQEALRLNPGNEKASRLLRLSLRDGRTGD